MSKSPVKAGADSGWYIVGRRGRAAAASARASNGATSTSEKKIEGEEEGEEEQEGERDDAPRPSRPSSSRVPPPRPRSQVVADLVASVRDCEREVFRSSAWRSLMARLDESEEDFFAEEEQQEQEEQEEEGGRRRARRADNGDDNAGGGAPPSPAAFAFSFRNVSRLTVLGLGSLESSRTSRLQAALALQLARERFPRVVLLSPPNKGGAEEGASEQGGGEEERDRRYRCSLFAADPVFTAADREALAELGFTVVAPEEAVEAGRAQRRRKRNEKEETEKEGATDDDLSFFYLPHCYPPVAEEVLEAHWNRDDIRKVAILGNSLSSVAEKILRKSSSMATASAAAATVAAATTTTTPTPRCLAAGSKSKSSARVAASASASSSAIIEASVVGPDLDAASARSGLGAAFNDTALHLFPRWTEEFAEI